MKRKITLNHIAKELGVSVSTVSKSLRNSSEISPDMRQKVQAFARLYNYKSNRIVLSANRQPSNTIGVIVPKIGYHFSEILNGIEQTASASGYCIMICLSGETLAKETRGMQLLAKANTDGFIIVPSEETRRMGEFHHISEFRNPHTPIVMIDYATNEIRCDKVVTDYQAAAYEATQNLIDNGKKRIVLLKTATDSDRNRQYAAGYARALRDNQLSFHETDIVRIDGMDFKPETIQKLAIGKKADALLVPEDFFSIPAFKSVWRNSKVAREILPVIASIAPDSFKMGQTAAQLLINRLKLENQEENYRTEVIDFCHVNRDSAL